MINADEKWFPCPVCLRPLDVRTSKRKKPYVICSPCGVQMFIRERAGIEAFEAWSNRVGKTMFWPDWPNWNGAAVCNAPSVANLFGLVLNQLSPTGSPVVSQVTAARRRTAEGSFCWRHLRRRRGKMGRNGMLRGVLRQNWENSSSNAAKPYPNRSEDVSQTQVERGPWRGASISKRHSGNARTSRHGNRWRCPVAADNHSRAAHRADVPVGRHLRLNL
jgi:hypothetical protein